MKKTDNYRVEYNTAIKSFADCEDELGIPAELDLHEALQRQLERERKSAAEYPEFYRLSNIMSSARGRQYRSGKDTAEAYMTCEDYLRLIVAETKIGEYGKVTRVKREQVQAVRPATVYNVRDIADTDEGNDYSCEGVVELGAASVRMVERSDSSIRGRAAKFVSKWFPEIRIEKPNKYDRRRLATSAAGILWVLIFALVVALPIALGVIKSDAASNLIDKKDELAALEKREDELISEFESSIDLREIERIAINDYGMIKLGQSTVRVLRLNDLDSIESFPESQRNTVLPALLSALGIRQSNE